MSDVEFISHIATVKNAAKQALMRCGEIIGMRMESHAKLYITNAVYQHPQGWYIRTGNLRNSITHAVQEDGEGNIVAVVGSAVEYAPYVELGTGIYAEDRKGRKTPWRYQDSDGNWHTTSGMPPRPFLRPAVQNHLQEYRQVLETELKPE